MNLPTQFGPYLLLERISVGGMAEVYKAKEYGVEGFERTVAVKRILPHVAEDDEFIAMFKDEAKIAVQLNHGNIAQIYNLGNEQDSFYIALEYINGRDLRAIFQKCQQQTKPMPVAQAVGQWYTRSLVRGRGNQSWFATLATIEEDAGVNVGTWPEEA